MDKRIFVSGATMILTGIVLGAFGAHALKNVLIEFPEKIASFETGVRYQIYGGISLLILSIAAEKLRIDLKWIFRLMLVGHLLFSLSIYLLIFAFLFSFKLSFLGPITPLGGTLIIVAWCLLLVKVIKNKN